jgi:hypothetical protein
MCGGITAAPGGMPIDQIGGAISNCGGITMQVGGGTLDLQGGVIIDCVNLQSNTTQMAFAANSAFYMEIAPPGANETSLLVYSQQTGALARVSIGAADSGGVGFKCLRIPN